VTIDDSDLEFLRAVSSRGVEATTSDIRVETGFSRGKTRYRFDKLENLGLISISYADESSGAGAAPRVAELTDTGTQLVRRRGIEKPDREDGTLAERIEALEERLERVENRLEVLVSIVHDREDWENTAEGWMGLTELWLRALREEVEGGLDADLDETMAEIDSET
jgi:DNA-binding Lrp family transcriptional regulator